MTAHGQKDSVLTFSQYPVDDDVSYKGGNDRMFKILKKNIKYPEQAIKDSIGGTVYVYFTIDTAGHSTDIKIIKGVREDIDKEAIRCVDLLNEWIPGRNNGKKVNSHHILPIKFSLTDKNKAKL
jgi:TonB family protein